LPRSHFDRGNVERQIEQGADALEEMADELYEATKGFEEKEAKWERHALIAEARIAQDEDQYGKTSERVRRGLVLETFREKPVYLEYVAARAQAHALDKKHRALAAAVNARQSLLRRQS
jgi:hypothetical protein